MCRTVLDQNQPGRSVHLRIGRLVDELRVLGQHLSAERAVFIIFLRFVP
jgi:hypothetical protein